MTEYLKQYRNAITHLQKLDIPLEDDPEAKASISRLEKQDDLSKEKAIGIAAMNGEYSIALYHILQAQKTKGEFLHTYELGLICEDENSPYYDLEKALLFYLATVTNGFKNTETDFKCTTSVALEKVPHLIHNGIGRFEERTNETLFWLEKIAEREGWSYFEKDELDTGLNELPGSPPRGRYDKNFLFKSDKLFLIYCEQKLKFILDENYVDLLNEIKIDQAEILKGFNNSKQEYFATKGLKFSCEWDVKKRYQFALDNFIRKSQPNYQSALLCFDIRRDFINAKGLNLLGFIYNEPDKNPLFSSSKSYRLFLKSAELGNHSAAFNIGGFYHNGDAAEKVDLNAALSWFERANQMGSIRAISWIAKVCLRNDARYNAAGYESFTSHVNSLVNKGVRLNQIESILDAIRINRLNSQASDYSLGELYKMVVNHKTPHTNLRERCIGLVNYSRRLFLGLNFSQDINGATRILNYVDNQKSSSPYIRKSLPPIIVKLKKKLDKQKQILNKPKNVSQFKFIKNIAEQGKDKYKVIDLIKERAIPVDSDLIDYLEVLNDLAASENWVDEADYKVFLMQAVCTFKGLSLTKIVASTFVEGPKYNKTSPAGLPVLGDWEEASKNKEQSETQFLQTGSYVPQAGVQAFKGVRAEEDGSIEFDFIMVKNKPAMLVPEDFETALILTFGHEKRALSPSLSLESPSDKNLSSELDVFEYKDWSPHWLGYTDLGRTLFVTDRLMGSLCWQTSEFDILTDSSRTDFAINLLEDIATTGGYSNGGHSRVMLVPEHISIDSKIETEGTKKTYEVKVKEVKMRVDGSYIVVNSDDGIEDRLVALNDPTFLHGRTVEKLTNRYTDICSLLPIFERARQIVGLCQGLKSLREIGYTPPEPMLSKIRSKYNKLSNLPKINAEDVLAVRLPLPELIIKEALNHG
ncbi:MAG: sel1 repeat family protein [Roseivirga sp.]|jgi:TPR repeat protein|uniref:tetratricopeptide repeat protein n=1 Tax=Roseivirga sp. TaxID=1964215 RepID=UPI001B230C4F|nr:hypothetical protein [Roseivirga sp.]MBO6497291.1 sel1 repeat family protein [Roseivirga sp.]